MGCCGGGRSLRFGPGGSNSHGPQEDVAAKNTHDAPIELLKQRLAKGEINLEEYEKLAKVISS